MNDKTILELIDMNNELQDRLNKCKQLYEYELKMRKYWEKKARAYQKELNAFIRDKNEVV